MAKKCNLNNKAMYEIMKVIKTNPNYSIKEIGNYLGLKPEEVKTALKIISKKARKKARKQKMWTRKSSPCDTLNNRSLNTERVRLQKIAGAQALEKSEEILELIRKDPKISEIDICQKLHLTFPEVEIALRKLSKERKIIILSKKERRRKLIDPCKSKKKRKANARYFGRRPRTEHGRSSVKIGPLSPRHS